MLDKYLYSMVETSKKFPAVITIKGILGLDEGSVLKFDWASGKYVSITEDEDIADDYYYSGYAVAIDPYVVKDNIGEYFAFIESAGPTEPEPTPAPATVEVEEPVPEIEQATEGIAESAEPKEIHALIIDCACGHRHLVQYVEGPGITATLMAIDPNSFIEMHCPECNSWLKLSFIKDEEK